MQVSQILPQARKIFSECPDEEIFPKIARAAYELSNMGPWDWTNILQYITLNCEVVQGQNGYITLPRFVEMPLQMNLDCFPAFPRNKAFIHHLNGPGDRTRINCYREFWDDKGEFCTLRNLTNPAPLIAVNLQPEDAALQIRVYGLDQNGNEAYGADGNPGILLAMNVATTVIFSSISSVFRPKGVGVITLAQADNQNLLGYYYPDELAPSYRRIRIPKSCKTVTITYKRAMPHIFSCEDWLPLKNFNAMITGMWYIFYIDKNDYQNAEAARSNAKRSLVEEQVAMTLQSPVGPQIQRMATQNATDRLYGNYGWGGFGGPNGP